ncbi:MAG: hypothetical protein ABI199_03535 [Bacteroidia bacterium]
MKKQTSKILTIVVSSSLAFAGCNGLSKMIKNADKVSYTVTPNPLDEKGDSVSVTIAGKYPAKFFAKKVTLTVTPSIKFASGGSKDLKPVTLVGEKAVGSGTKISYDNGGSFSYTDVVAYQPEMKEAELDVKATGTVKSKSKDFPAKKIADGTIATSLLVKNDERPIIGKDNFQKTIPEHDTTRIFYTISQSVVRPSEMKSEEMKKFKDFMDNGTQQNYVWDGINVDAYASPDGETEFNAHLAEDRAKTAIKAMIETFKNMKMEVEKANKKGKEHKVDEKLPVDSKLAEESFYKVVNTGMDWIGFKTKVENSNIKDKDLILRVLTMYSDHDQRMKAIKDLAKTYTELADNILPKLRRAIIIVDAEKKSRTDAQISQLVTSHPDSLSVEELLYAATLTNDVNAKMNIYQTAEKQYGKDWRTSNNVGYADIMQNKVSDADAEFQKANQLSPSNPIIQNNMGIVALMKGDRKTAAADFKNATGAGPEVSYNMGTLDIMTGDYASAVSSFGADNSFNSALAKLLNGNPGDVSSTLDASTAKDDALSYYLKAVAAARNGKADELVNNLKTAISKDATLKDRAKTDCEFLKFKDNSDFKAAIQ